MSEKPKKKLTCLFRENAETPEGKYLVLRRDGTVPGWPSFVLGGADPHASIALLAYANSCATDKEIDPGFVAAVRRWSSEFDLYRLQNGPGDPGMGQHRKDEAWVIQMMKLGRSA